MTKNIQFIVITLNDERKRLIEQQFEELGIPFPVHYLSASTPQTSQSYISKSFALDEKMKKIMCCDRSHLRAVQYAGQESSPEFSIIFEDDVALHTKLFTKGVQELLENWESFANQKTMLSLGWVPCSNYESYVSIKSCYAMKCSQTHRILCDRYTVGLQAYMIQKDTAKFVENSLLKETYNEYHAICDKHLNNKGDYFYAFDVFLPKYLDVKYMFPPLVIEQNIPSTLGHKNELQYWPLFFKGYKLLQDDYWNNVKVQCIVIYEERRAAIERQFKELSLPFPVHFLKASENNHLHAMEYAGLYTSPKFSLIMEDNVVIHKHAFVPAVNELIKNWSSTNMKCVALGWKPMANFDSYIGGNSLYSFESSPSHRIMDDMNIGGLQAYLIPKSSVKESTLSAKYVFPPLAIEHNSVEQSRFFEGYEHLRNEYWSTNVQVIVIWLTEERRTMIEQQFKELDIPFPVHYMKASSPQSVSSYLYDKHTPSQQKLSCCGHSHFRALEYAGQDSAPEFTVVCEDDVSLHKTLFIDAVKEIAMNWKDVVGNSSPQSMVSLGWVPCYNFASYVPGKSVYKFKVSSKHDIKNDRWTVGTQSYMVHKESAKITAKKFLTETYAEYLKLANKVEKLFEVSYPIDHLLQRYLTVRYVFPPLAVDQQLESTINDGPDPGFYNIFFKNYEHLRNDYWTQNKIQCIVISLNEERRKLIEQQFKELSIPFPVYFLTASTPDTLDDYTPSSYPSVMKRTIACAHSHLRALQYAGLDSSPEFSVIFEDDVALHKKGFINTVLELQKNWTTVINNHKNSIVSLGWIPCSNYDSYTSAPSLYAIKSAPTHKIMRDRYIVGLQSYMVPKRVANDCAKLFLKENYQGYLSHAKKFFNTDESFIAIDFLLPRYFSMLFTFPPLVIEQPLCSSLGHDNIVDYWSRFFDGYEHLKDDYWSRS